MSECTGAAAEGVEPEAIQEEAMQFMREAITYNLGAPGSQYNNDVLSDLRARLRMKLSRLPRENKGGTSLEHKKAKLNETFDALTTLLTLPEDEPPDKTNSYAESSTDVGGEADLLPCWLNKFQNSQSSFKQHRQKVIEYENKRDIKLKYPNNKCSMCHSPPHTRPEMPENNPTTTRGTRIQSNQITEYNTTAPINPHNGQPASPIEECERALAIGHETFEKDKRVARSTHDCATEAVTYDSTRTDDKYQSGQDQIPKQTDLTRTPIAPERQNANATYKYAMYTWNPQQPMDQIIWHVDEECSQLLACIKLQKPPTQYSVEITFDEILADINKNKYGTKRQQIRNAYKQLIEHKNNKSPMHVIFQLLTKTLGERNLCRAMINHNRELEIKSIKLGPKIDIRDTLSAMRIHKKELSNNDWESLCTYIISAEQNQMKTMMKIFGEINVRKALIKIQKEIQQTPDFEIKTKKRGSATGSREHTIMAASTPRLNPTYPNTYPPELELDSQTSNHIFPPTYIKEDSCTTSRCTNTPSMLPNHTPELHTPVGHPTLLEQGPTEQEMLENHPTPDLHYPNPRTWEHHPANNPTNFYPPTELTPSHLNLSTTEKHPTHGNKPDGTPKSLSFSEGPGSHASNINMIAHNITYCPYNLRAPTNHNALVVHVLDDKTTNTNDTQDALTTHPEIQGDPTILPHLCIVDSGCFVDLEDERGTQGFKGDKSNCYITLVTGTDEHTRPQYKCTHVQYLIDTNDEIIEDVRHGVYSCASTSFKRCLFSPNTAATRGITTVLVPANKGPSYLEFPSGKRVALINTGKSYLLPRFFTRENAEQARIKQSLNRKQHMTLIPALNMEATEQTTDTSSAVMWHRRLGHRSMNILQLLHEHCLDGPTFKTLRPVTKANIEACAICPAARLKRKSQPKLDPTHPHLPAARINCFGQLVARDHMGPLTKSFFHGYTMGMILADMHTGGIWFYGQREKSADESLNVIKRFEADTAEFGPILNYHSDGAKELIGEKFQQYCLNKQPPTKITYTTTAASNSNAMAENAVYRLLSIARALLIDSGIPHEHWPSACAHASDIIQATPRVYTRQETNKGTLISTPHYMLKAQLPSLKHLYLYGCVCHALLHPNSLKSGKTHSRFENRTIVGFWVGNSRLQRGGCRIWCPDESTYTTALTVKVDQSHTYRSLQYPKSVVSTFSSLPPFNDIQPPKAQGSTVTLANPFQELAANTPDNGTLTSSLQPQTNHTQEDLNSAESDPEDAELVAASRTRPSPPLRLPKGTRISVYCDNYKYYPGVILGVRPGPGTSHHHCIRYDGWRRKYWHDLAEELWRYEKDPGPPYIRTPMTLTRGLGGDEIQKPTTRTPVHTGDNHSPRDEITDTSPSNEAPGALSGDEIDDSTSEEEAPTDASDSTDSHAKEQNNSHPTEDPSKGRVKRDRKKVDFFVPEDFKDLRKQNSRQLGALYTSTAYNGQATTVVPLGKNKSELVLNLFSGPYHRPDGLTAALKQRGYQVEEIDHLDRAGGPDHDILKDSFYAKLLRKAKNNEYRAVYAAPPCSTFSVSRFHDYKGPDPLDRGPPVIRTREHILGLPDVPARHENELRNANLLVTRCTTLIDLIAKGGGSFVIENPADRGNPNSPITYDPKFKNHGPLWCMPSILDLVEKYDATTVTYAACMLGARHQKYSTLLISPDLLPTLGHLSELICSHSKGEHQRIVGKDEEGGWNSSLAAAYTPELSAALAAALPPLPRTEPALTTNVMAPPSENHSTQDSPENPDYTVRTNVDPLSTALTNLPTDQEALEDQQALTTSILSLERSTTVLDYIQDDPDSQGDGLESNTIRPELDMLNHGEQELYHILTTTTENVKMILDETGSIIPRKVPKNYDEAMASEDATGYLEAMKLEVARHESIPSYTLVEKPPGERILPSIWAYDLKLDKNLRPRKYKARLCAGGHRCIRGEHFWYSHSTTTSLDAFRIMVAVSAYYAQTLHEDDYSTAYLNAPIDTNIYMQQPRGFSKIAPSGRPFVCKLNRAIYGLPQSGRLWQHTHTKELERLGFEQCVAEHALFKKQTGDNRIFLLVNVDNLYSSSNNEEYRKAEINELRKIFELNYLGPVEHTLGVRVTQSPKIHHITLDQEQYIQSLAEKFTRFDSERPVKKRVSPYAVGLSDLQPLNENHPEALKWRTPCLRLAGALNWVATFTRPDVSYALNMATRCIQGAHEGVYEALLHLLGFLTSTAHWRLAYGKDVDAPLREHIVAHTRNLRLDVLQPGDPITFVDAGGGVKPTQCAFTYLFGGIVSARVSKLTSTVLSVTEGEYFGATAGASRLMAIAPLLEFLGVPHRKPFIILCDNKAACMLTDSDHTTKRMRHVLTRLRYLQEHVDNGNIMLAHIQTVGNVADIGTKVHSTKVVHKLTSLMYQ